jgi:hypothetical protein
MDSNSERTSSELVGFFKVGVCCTDCAFVGQGREGGNGRGGRLH